MSMVKHP
jgi:hypothetical protein